MNRLTLIEKINSLKLIQNEYWADFEYPKEIEDILVNLPIVDSGLCVDKHRWYETSIVVYKLNDEFFGIKYVTDVFSESSSISDIYHTIIAIPMKEIQTITYRKE